MYHWDVLVTYNWDVVGCFIWDWFETLWRRTDGTSSLRPLETSSQHTSKTSWRRTTETSWRRSTETSFGVSFETYLRRRWDVQKDIVTTLPRRLVAGWEVVKRHFFRNGLEIPIIFLHMLKTHSNVFKLNCWYKFIWKTFQALSECSSGLQWLNIFC